MEASGVLTDPVAETQTIEQPVEPDPAPVEAAAPFPSQEAIVPDTAPVEASPAPVPAVVEPNPGSVTLITGQKYEVVDLAKFVDEILAEPVWVTVDRPNQTPITVRSSAVITYE